MIHEDLYADIVRSMPIPCVDILVSDQNQVLLLRRANDPARNCWWFPGGRILHGESRTQAVRRKMLEETGLKVSAIKEMKTFELFLPHEDGYLAHGITTVFSAQGSSVDPVKVDEQTIEARWMPTESILNLDLHPFVRGLLTECVTSEASGA